MSAPSHEQPPAVVGRIGRRGTLVIPAALRQKLGLEQGTPIIAEERDGGLFVRPLVPATDAISAEERQAVLLAANRAYAALRADATAWADDGAARAAWERLAGETLPPERWTADDVEPAG